MYKTLYCFILLFVVNGVVGQSEIGQLVSNTREQKFHVAIGHFSMCQIQGNVLFGANDLYFKRLAPQFINAKPTAKSFFYTSCAMFPQNLFSRQSGWFCKQEWKLEKSTGVPLRVRLGSKEMVDYFEGKQLHR